MKQSIRALIILFVAVCCTLAATAQNWETFGGNSTRNGLSRMTGPVTPFSQVWQVQSGLNSSFGMAVYSFGDRFVNARTEFSPYTSRIECRELSTGNLLWISPFISSSSILYAIGMTEDAVYAHDYDTDSVYALNLSDGSLKWRSPVLSHTFGAWPGCVFACNGDPVLNAPVSSGQFTMRLDKHTGDTVWSNSQVIVIGPAVPMAASATTVYRITGGIFFPVLLTAIDINTGLTRYSSDPIPGDPDQEDPLIIGPDDRIYFWRDNGNLFAYTDNGTALVQDWMYVPSAPVTTLFLRNITFGHDNTLYIFENGSVKRLDAGNGVVRSSLSINIGSSASISVGADSTVYINDGQGNILAYSADLQTLKWQRNIPTAIYLNPPLCREGTMVLTEAGTTITGLRDTRLLAPVADFRCSARKVFAGQPVDFFDQSSYAPTAWEWEFPGSSQPTSSSQNPTGVVYNSTGVFPVTLKVQNAIGQDSLTSKCYVEVLNFTNLPEADRQDFTVYPNPVSRYLRINSPMHFLGVAFQVFDLQGNTVLSDVVRQQEQLLDIGQLASGVYFLRMDSYGQPVVPLVKE